LLALKKVIRRMSKSAGDHRSNAQKSVISGTPETRSVSQWTGGMFASLTPADF